MGKKKKDIKELLSSIPIQMNIAHLFAVIVLLSPPIIYLSAFGSFTLSNDINDWTSFSNFFQGISTPLLTYITIILLVFTFFREDIRKSEELNNWNKEFAFNSIISLLSFYTEEGKNLKFEAYSESIKSKDPILVRTYYGDELFQDLLAYTDMFNKLYDRINLDKYNNLNKFSYMEFNEENHNIIQIADRIQQLKAIVSKRILLLQTIVDSIQDLRFKKDQDRLKNLIFGLAGEHEVRWFNSKHDNVLLMNFISNTIIEKDKFNLNNFNQYYDKFTNTYTKIKDYDIYGI